MTGFQLSTISEAKAGAQDLIHILLDLFTVIDVWEGLVRNRHAQELAQWLPTSRGAAWHGVVWAQERRGASAPVVGCSGWTKRAGRQVFPSSSI